MYFVHDASRDEVHDTDRIEWMHNSSAMTSRDVQSDPVVIFEVIL